MKSCAGQPFKTFLACHSLLWNCNYGPFNTREWRQRKRARVKDMLSSGQARNVEPFLSFIPWIPEERGVTEPTCSEERLQLLTSLDQLKSIESLGPVVKLMRWYSWFQSEHFYSGENWMTKYLMCETKTKAVTDTCNYTKDEESFSMPAKGLSDRQELHT